MDATKPTLMDPSVQLNQDYRLPVLLWYELIVVSMYNVS